MKSINYTKLERIFSSFIEDGKQNNFYSEILNEINNTIKNNFISLILFKSESNLSDYSLYSLPSIKEKIINEFEKELKTNLLVITKWLNINKKSLVTSQKENNLLLNFFNILNTTHLLLTPIFFNKKLLGIIICSRKEKEFAEWEINLAEEFSFFIGMMNSFMNSLELNRTLENKLFQAQKLETVGKIASGIAHDFNNILSIILASINLLKKKVKNNPNALKLVDSIEESASRARELTKNLLSYSRPSSKLKERVDTKKLTNEVAEALKHSVKKDIQVKININENLFDIFANYTQIYQVMLNLGVNANDAIDGPGEIIFSVYNKIIDDKNQFDFPLLKKGRYVCFSVKDTGIGISEENLQKIFEPYFSTKKKDKGSGLGLYVSYGIIKAHNGNIEVYSEIGKGTEFIIFIPAFYEEKKEEISPQEKIILLADDEIMLQDLIAELLETVGYYVIKVQSGEEVLEILKDVIKVDLLIIDYNMSKMNGLECIEQIRKLKLNVPIILSSGSLIFQDNIQIENYGVNSVLQKPYDFDTMLNEVRKIIG
ncbi:MAG: hypothetical protein STSR0008_00370 [Ignavibacterium sp.]